ncbi:MAG: LuxR family transcriptional regulator [Bacteroidota bacterium]|nr:LuxR family transcriptional regulator [Bacteroidota bacterium]MDP4233105.1 LuxR family transcriptional regulator [Bacteroidota bacterium]MDP4241750.1 LuxR family transcriptional regulator [Bacteroidota bacterium]MDP4287408.1 LuxR family transcriptional regulator [Bacteroidota bacterium]
MTHDQIAALLSKAEEQIRRGEYARAEALANKVLSTNTKRDEDEAQALCVLGMCCKRLGRWDESLTNFQNALVHAEAASNLALQSRILNEVARRQSGRGEHQSALQTASLARDRAEQACDKRWQAEALNTIGIIHGLIGENWLALEHLTQAMALAEAAGDKKSVASILCHMGVVQRRLANYEAALEHYDRALPLAEEAQATQYVASILQNLGNVYGCLADYSQSLNYYVRALEIEEQIGDKDGIGSCLLNIGSTLLMLGDYPRALDHMTRALAFAEACGHKSLAANSVGGIGDAYLRLSDYSHALEYYVRFHALAVDLNNKAYISRSLLDFGMLYFRVSDHSNALNSFAQSMEIAEEIGDMSAVADCLGSIGDIYSAIGDYPRAVEYLRRALDQSTGLGTPRAVGVWRRSIAIVERRMGNLEAAHRGLLECVQFSREILKSNEDVAATLLELGGVLIEQGKAKEALRPLAEAVKLSEELGEKQTSSEAHKEIANVYSMVGQLAIAFEHLTKHLALNKEVFSEESRKKVEQFNMRVAIAEKEKEREIEKMKREQTERELSNTMLQLVAQTELVQEIRTDLVGIMRKFPLPDGAAKELRKRLKVLPCKSVDWAKFDTQFKAAHPEFTKKLAELHPTLTAMELRVCSLLRMNLTSEEIARLFCLSPRSIESHRFRIRKRIGIPRTTDLAVYLAKV